jgi:hypothetical protein
MESITIDKTETCRRPLLCAIILFERKSVYKILFAEASFIKRIAGPDALVLAIVKLLPDTIEFNSSSVQDVKEMMVMIIKIYNDI